MAPRRGFTLIELLVGIAIVAVLIGLLLPAVARVRDASYRTACANNLRQIGLALHHYHDAHRALPPGMKARPDPYAYLAWSGRILPFLEQEALWQQTVTAFRQTPFFGYDPPHVGLGTPLAAYVCPADGRRTAEIAAGPYTVALTHYFGVAGSFSANGVLYPESQVPLADVSDGTATTLLVGERPPVPVESGEHHLGWWYGGFGQNFDGSADYLLQVREFNRSFRMPTCPRGPYNFGPGRDDNPCDLFHFWSRHLGGAHFLFCDGSVRFLAYSADSVLPALATRAGGETVALPD